MYNMYNMYISIERVYIIYIYNIIELPRYFADRNFNFFSKLGN